MSPALPVWVNRRPFRIKCVMGLDLTSYLLLYRNVVGDFVGAMGGAADVGQHSLGPALEAVQGSSR